MMYLIRLSWRPIIPQIISSAVLPVLQVARFPCSFPRTALRVHHTAGPARRLPFNYYNPPQRLGFPWSFLSQRLAFPLSFLSVMCAPSFAHPITYDNLPSLTIEQLCSANYSSLKNVIRTAPPHVRNEHLSLPRSVYKLLAIILSIREDLILQAQHVQENYIGQDDRELMEKMLSLTPEEVETRAEENLSELVNMVKAALRVDETHEPRDYTENDKYSVNKKKKMTRFILMWQLKATRAALERRESQEHHQENQPDLQAEPPPPKRKNPLSDSSDAVLNTKKPKVLRIAGVPTGEGEEAQDFWQGLGGAAPIRPSQLQAYPGRTAVLLNVQELMGPSILHSFCQEGMNIELVIRNVRWPRQADGRPYSSEIEALTLARCLHFHLCRFETMEQAVTTSPWTEIALRRLWALLEVQTLTSGPSPLTREEASQQVLPSLEVYPDIGIRVPAMRTIVNRQISAASRARNAVRSLARRNQTPLAKNQRKRSDAGQNSGKKPES